MSLAPKAFAIYIQLHVPFEEGGGDTCCRPCDGTFQKAHSEASIIDVWNCCLTRLPGRGFAHWVMFSCHLLDTWDPGSVYLLGQCPGVTAEAAALLYQGLLGTKLSGKSHVALFKMKWILNTT